MIVLPSVAVVLLAALWLERRPRPSRHAAAARVCVLWILAVAGGFAAFGSKPITPSIVCVAVVLWVVPSAIWVYATLHSACLRFRASMHAIANTAILLLALPYSIFAVFGGSWRILLDQPNWKISLWLHLIFPPAVLGLSAIQEFCVRGAATPDPCDAPHRFVSSGIYSYIANPMEVAAVFLIAAIGVVAHSLAALVIAAAGAIYFLLGADRREQKDLAGRFGDEWHRYRKTVPAWRFRWRPFVQGTAVLYIAQSCGVCSDLGRWFACRKTVGLRLAAAEDYPTGNLTRLTYDPGDGGGEEHGVAALARALEHIDLGRAFCGFIIRLPLLRPLIQVLVDASGGEAWLITRDSGASQCAPASFVINPT